MERITGKTRVISLLGDPISHSKSPMLQNNVFAKMGLDYVYVAFQIGKSQLEEAVNAIRTLNFRGSNVTMPDKMEIVKYLDELSPAAKMAGAVNTVVNDNGHLTGHITDGVGFIMSLNASGISISGKKIVLIGMGGAGTAICVQAALDSAKQIRVFNRKDSFYPRALEKTALIKKETGCDVTLHDLGDKDTLKKELSHADLLVNATPIGMEATIDECLIPDKSYFHNRLVVADAIYVPEQTKLLQMAADAGCQTVSGIGMQLYQGVKSFELWTGRQMPVEYAKSILSQQC